MACPVKNNSNDGAKPANINNSSNNLSTSSSTSTASGILSYITGHPDQNNTDDTSKSACPVDHTTITKYNDAASDVAFGQERLADQKKLLSTNRSASTIPKSDFTPDHQPKNVEKWIYPSGT